MQMTGMDSAANSTASVVTGETQRGFERENITAKDVLVPSNTPVPLQPRLHGWQPQSQLQEQHQLHQQQQIRCHQLVKNEEALPSLQVKITQSGDSQRPGCLSLQQQPLEEQQKWIRPTEQYSIGLHGGLQQQAQSRNAEEIVGSPAHYLLQGQQWSDQQQQQQKQQNLPKTVEESGQYYTGGRKEDPLPQLGQQQMLEQQRLQQLVLQQHDQQQQPQQLPLRLEPACHLGLHLDRQQAAQKLDSVQQMPLQQEPQGTALQQSSWTSPSQQVQQQVQRQLQQQVKSQRALQPATVSGSVEPHQSTATMTMQEHTALHRELQPLPRQELQQQQLYQQQVQQLQQRQLQEQQLQHHQLLQQQLQHLRMAGLYGQAPALMMNEEHKWQQRKDHLQPSSYEALGQQQINAQHSLQQQRQQEVALLQQLQAQAQHQKQMMGADGPAKSQAGFAPPVNPPLSATEAPTAVKCCGVRDDLPGDGAGGAAPSSVSVFNGDSLSNSSAVQRQQLLRIAGLSRTDTPAATERGLPTKTPEAAGRPGCSWVRPPRLEVQQQAQQHLPGQQDVQLQRDAATISRQSTFTAGAESAAAGLLTRRSFSSDNSSSSGSGRRRSFEGGKHGCADYYGQAFRSSQRGKASPKAFCRWMEETADPVTVVSTRLSMSSGTEVHVPKRGRSNGAVASGPGASAALSGFAEGSDDTHRTAETQQQRKDRDFVTNGSKVDFAVTAVASASPDATAATLHGAAWDARVRTASLSEREHSSSRREHAFLRSPWQPRSSSLAAAVTFSKAAASVAKRSSSAFALPSLETCLPPEFLSDLQQHGAVSSAAHHTADEVLERLEVLRKATSSKRFIPSLHLKSSDGSQQLPAQGLSSSARAATHAVASQHSSLGVSAPASECGGMRRLQESSEDTEISREWRASADVLGGLRHRPLLRHETAHFHGGVGGTRQRIFLSESMGRNAEKERRRAGGRVARPLWHEVPSEETPRKLNLTSFVGETWTSRLKGKLIIVVRRLPFDIRTTSNCLAKLECLLLGQADGVQSPASPSFVSACRVGSLNSICERAEWRGRNTGTATPTKPKGYPGLPLCATSALASNNLRGGEEVLIGPSLSAEDLSRVGAGGPPSRSWGSTAETDADTDSGRRDAFRLRSLALARELLRRVRSEMQLVPQRGKAIRNLLEAPFGPPIASRSDANLLQPREIVPTNPADYICPAAASTPMAGGPLDQPGYLQQDCRCSVDRGRTGDMTASKTESSSPADRIRESKQSPTTHDRVSGSTSQSREKSVSKGQTPQRGAGSAAIEGAATDGLVVLSGADIAWDIATTLKPYVPCITISDLGIDWEEMGLTGSEQQLMQQRVLDTVRRQHPSVHPISLGKESRRECYSEQILNTLFHCRTPPVGTGFSHLDWQGYVRMNEEFAKAVQQDYTEGDVVLIYDYHFMLLPLMLRQAIPKATIVVHWATVFPSSEMFRILPQREPLLNGLLGADLITFQAYAFHRQFANTCRMLRGPGALMGVRLAIVPRGLDPTPWLQQMRLQKSGGPSDWEELREKLGGRTVFVSVDSISANSGIPHKMVAFRHFLQEHPEYINKVVFVQAAITDSTAPDTFLDQDPRQPLSETECHELLSQVYHFVGCINSEFGAVASQAVHFLTVPWTAEGLSPLFACADVCLATSVRESFSWAAYAFILCQKFSNKGVLILSEFSGSAQALGAGALMVNPWNARSFAAALLDALNMSEQERAERHAYAYRYCTKHSDKMWARQLLTELGTVLRTPSRDANAPGDSATLGTAASSAP